MWRARNLNRLVLVLLLASTDASAAECTKAQAMSAENEASTLNSWKAVHKSFQRYAHCDDGAIAEGYSESITLLLANQWSTLASLVKLMAEDPPFERFIIRHIDETVPRERLTKIASNAKRSCPKKHRSLCE